MNALYSIRFRTRQGEGAGTIYLVNNKIYGGDAIVAYWGNYEIKDNKFIATISTKQHNYGLSILGEIKNLKMEIPFYNENSIKGSVLIPSIAEQLDVQLFKIVDL